MTDTPTNADRFWAAYARHLAAAIDNHPEKYVGLLRRWGDKSVLHDTEIAVARWVESLRPLGIGAIDITTPPFGLTCREMRINRTEAAIRQFLQETPT